MCGLVGGLVPRAPRVAFEGSRIKVRNLSHPKVEGFSFFAKRYPVVIDAPQIDFVSSFADRHFYFTLIGGGKVTLDVARFLNAKERKELRYRVIAVRDAAAESKDSASRAG
jgi:hypothetical protein